MRCVDGVKALLFEQSVGGMLRSGSVLLPVESTSETAQAAAVKKPSILLLNQFFPPDCAASGQLLADLASELAACGSEVHVVCSRGGYGGRPLPIQRRSKSLALSDKTTPTDLRERMKRFGEFLILRLFTFTQ